MKNPTFAKAEAAALAPAFIIMMALAGCPNPSISVSPGGGGGGTGGGGSSSGTSKSNAIPVTVGYSSSHTISSSGEHWFKLTGTGDPVIFETSGNVVDTQMYIWVNDNYLSSYGDDNSGEGYNALESIATTIGEIYYIRIEPRSGTTGTYTFAVTAPTFNIRTNPMHLALGYSSPHTISSSGQHWFRFQGTGDTVMFETTNNVVDTNIKIYTGNSTSAIIDVKTRISFKTVSGTTYYINITGNSGTYNFSVYNGTGNGTSRANSIPVTVGHWDFYTISSSGQHWFNFMGTGDPVIFKTSGNVVDTQMYIWVNDNYLSSYGDDNSGEGYNAQKSINTALGTMYFIRIEPRSGTAGTYSFLVSNPE
jgi:hypothetical protein